MNKVIRKYIKCFIRWTVMAVIPVLLLINTIHAFFFSVPVNDKCNASQLIACLTLLFSFIGAVAGIGFVIHWAFNEDED